MKVDTSKVRDDAGKTETGDDQNRATCVLSENENRNEAEDASKSCVGQACYVLWTQVICALISCLCPSPLCVTKTPGP